LLNIKFFFL